LNDLRFGYWQDQKDFLSTKGPDRLLSLLSVLFGGHHDVFPLELRLGRKVTFHILLIPRLKVSGAVPLLPPYAFVT
jgi:hypothetical protein